MCFFKWKHGGKLKKFSFSIIKELKKKNSDHIHCALVCNLHQSVRLPGNKLIAL